MVYKDQLIALSKEKLGGGFEKNDGPVADHDQGCSGRLWYPDVQVLRTRWHQPAGPLAGRVGAAPSRGNDARDQRAGALVQGGQGPQGGVDDAARELGHQGKVWHREHKVRAAHLRCWDNLGAAAHQGGHHKVQLAELELHQPDKREAHRRYKPIGGRRHNLSVHTREKALPVLPDGHIQRPDRRLQPRAAHEERRSLGSAGDVGIAAGGNCLGRLHPPHRWRRPILFRPISLQAGQPRCRNKPCRRLSAERLCRAAQRVDQAPLPAHPEGQDRAGHKAGVRDDHAVLQQGTQSGSPRLAEPGSVRTEGRGNGHAPIKEVGYI